jgi:hypothetical protein
MFINDALHIMRRLAWEHRANKQYMEAWKTIQDFAVARFSDVVSDKRNDCETCQHDGECYVTMIKCKGYSPGN